MCLEHDCHVYVEKPFTLNEADAQRLVALANKRKLKLTVGHDDQFSHVARRMRALVQNGYLGGRPVHMESSYCYDLSRDAYARALLGDQRHWVRQLPGSLLQNVISHYADHFQLEPFSAAQVATLADIPEKPVATT